MNLGQKIKKLRKNHRWSQVELAKKLGITKAHLSRLETNRGKPSIDVLKKLCESLRVSADYLLSETNQENKDVVIRDLAFAEKIQLIDTLEKKDKELIVYMIESLLTKKKILSLIKEEVPSM